MKFMDKRDTASSSWKKGGKRRAHLMEEEGYLRTTSCIKKIGKGEEKGSSS